MTNEDDLFILDTVVFSFFHTIMKTVMVTYKEQFEQNTNATRGVSDIALDNKLTTIDSLKAELRKERLKNSTEITATKRANAVFLKNGLI